MRRSLQRQIIDIRPQIIRLVIFEIVLLHQQVLKRARLACRDIRQTRLEFWRDHLKIIHAAVQQTDPLAARPQHDLLIPVDLVVVQIRHLRIHRDSGRIYKPVLDFAICPEPGPRRPVMIRMIEPVIRIHPVLLHLPAQVQIIHTLPVEFIQENVQIRVCVIHIPRRQLRILLVRLHRTCHIQERNPAALQPLLQRRHLVRLRAKPLLRHLHHQGR